MYKPEANKAIVRYVVRFLQNQGDPVLLLGSLSHRDAYDEAMNLAEALETIEEYGAAKKVRMLCHTVWRKGQLHQSDER